MEARPRHPTGDSSGLIFTQPSSPHHSALRLMSKNSCALLFHFSLPPPRRLTLGFSEMEEIGGVGFPVYTRCLLQSFHSHCAFSRWIRAAFAQCGGERNAAGKKIALRRFVHSARRVGRLARTISPGGRYSPPPRGSFAATLLVCESPLFKEKMKRVISGNCFRNTSETLYHSLLMEHIGTSIKMTQSQ